MIEQRELQDLASLAWDGRRNARILGSTAVGAAVLGASGGRWLGCNVEHKFRSHDIHAEVNAVGNMIVAGEELPSENVSHRVELALIGSGNSVAQVALLSCRMLRAVRLRF
jgi:cytidine deaminase